MSQKRIVRSRSLAARLASNALHQNGHLVNGSLIDPPHAVMSSAYDKGRGAGERRPSSPLFQPLRRQPGQASQTRALGTRCLSGPTLHNPTNTEPECSGSQFGDDDGSSASDPDQCQSQQKSEDVSTDVCQSGDDTQIVGGYSTLPHTTQTPCTSTNTTHNLLYGPGGSVFVSRAQIKQLYPQESVRVFCSTWNLAGQGTLRSSVIQDWLFASGPSEERPIDIYALAMQEVHSYHMCFHYDVVQSIEAVLGSKYTTFLWVRKFGQMLLIFVRTNLLPYCTDPDWEFIPSTAVTKPARTKGAIAGGFRVFHSALLFIGCHLSHKYKVDRVRDYHKISQCFKFSRHIKRSGYSAVSSFDRVFWFGDLNFRVHEHTVIDKAGLAVAMEMGDNPVLGNDQLTHEMSEGTVFERFREGTITFAPTYKYDIGTNNYNKRRCPAYTDRVLYRTNNAEPNSIQVLCYTSVHSLTLSDHKPVLALFTVKIVPDQKYSVSSAPAIMQQKNGGFFSSGANK